ncbi:hypothetical protein [Photobacterium leiognathi]|uniref:hypothetical protein n=1 Tax=Photobacterium leiognathi TaxID=553611 RepID=UPI002980BD5D|nr:hypothetical protein [Photobacterium leiognathi]
MINSTNNTGTAKIINWYKDRHPTWQLSNGNTPLNPETQKTIDLYYSTIIETLEKEFGEITITYGFTSLELYKRVQKLSPQHTAPNLDQHAGYELNSRNNRICKRDGLACDFLIKGYENDMGTIAKYIVRHLPFDRLYFYGNNKPLHVSIGPENSQFIQYLLPSQKSGRRYPSKRYNKDNYLDAEFKEYS